MQNKSMFKSVKTQTACNFVNVPYACYRPKFLLALKRAEVSLLRRIINKLTSVFYASVLLLIINLVITLSK